jgi:hypothetical protein
VRAHEIREVGRHRLGLDGEQMGIEAGWAAHRLRGIVEEEVEAVLGVDQIAREQLDRGGVAEVQAVHLEPMPPGGEIRLLRITPHGIVREPRGRDDVGARAQQLQRGLEADLDAGPGDERHPALERGRLEALLVVELGAGRAHRVVEEVQLAVGLLADVTRARLLELGGVGRSALTGELPGRRHVDGGLARGPDPGRSSCGAVGRYDPLLFRAAERLQEAALLMVLGPGDPPGRDEQRLALLVGNGGQQGAILHQPLEQADGLAHLGDLDLGRGKSHLCQPAMITARNGPIRVGSAC